jgi:ecdysteroid 25-hydroxylase CYP306A1
VCCVVLSDPALIRESFGRSEFTGRAPLFLTHGIMAGFGLIGAEGPLWKSQRKFAAEFLRSFGLTHFKVGFALHFFLPSIITLQMEYLFNG